MKCPKCYAMDLSVLSTRTQDTGIILRRRSCDECGFRFNTYELPPGAYSYVRYDINRWAERQTSEWNTKIAQRKRLAAQMRTLRAQGMLAKQVAEKFGMSVHMVWYYTKPIKKEKPASDRPKAKPARASRDRTQSNGGHMVAVRPSGREAAAKGSPTEDEVPTQGD